MNKLLGTAFRDLFGNLMLMFMLFILLPQQPDISDDKTGEVDKQGQIIITAAWSPGIDVDLDLWVKHPGKKAVGWRNTGDINCNLLRDDLGKTNEVDPTMLNFEQIQCRVIEQGEWRINVNYWRGSVPNVRVRVKAEMWKNNLRYVIGEEVLTMHGECFEDTALHFYVDEFKSSTEPDQTFESIRTSDRKGCVNEGGI